MSITLVLCVGACEFDVVLASVVCVQRCAEIVRGRSVPRACQRSQRAVRLSEVGVRRARVIGQRVPRTCYRSQFFRECDRVSAFETVR